MADQARLCAICRMPIAAERLEAVPETWLCREHAGMIEKYGGEFRMTVRQESLGKVGSLKKNYGGVNVRRTRNLAALEKLREEYENLLPDKTDG
jgi:hypothetical protein